MTSLEADLREAFEAQDHEIASVTVNRGTVRLALRDDAADRNALGDIARSVLDEEEILGLTVTREAVDDGDQLGTVISFRQRR